MCPGRGARRSPKVRPSRALGARAPVEKSGWRGIGPRRRVMAAGGRLEDVSEAPSPVPAIPASCAGLRGAETAGCERPRASAAWTGGDAGCAGLGRVGMGHDDRGPGEPSRIKVAGGTRPRGREGPFGPRLTCTARLWFRNWEPHVTRAGLTFLPERGRQAGGGLQAPGEPAPVCGSCGSSCGGGWREGEREETRDLEWLWCGAELQHPSGTTCSSHLPETQIGGKKQKPVSCAVLNVGMVGTERCFNLRWMQT